jgi:uncharacterized protein YbjT (DUF2867 family)
MNILLFGATGMVGDGVLRWLIASARVDCVVAVSRKALSVQHAKLQTLIESDMFRRLAAAMLQLAIAGSPKKTLNASELNAVAVGN